MKRWKWILPMAGLVTALGWLGCEGGNQVVSSTDEQPAQLAAKPAGPPGLEAKSQFRVPTGRGDERLTVFVFYARGGKGGGGGGGKPPKDDGGGGGKPPKDDDGGGEEQCSDLNTNAAYTELGVVWPTRQIPVAYQPSFEPGSVAGRGAVAVNNAFGRWEGAAVPGDEVVIFGQDGSAPLPPEQDGSNVVGWRKLIGGKDARRILAATYIWDDGNGTILEADIVYNTSQKWAVNESISSGSSTCGRDYDVEAIGVHEIGHFLGLGHVADDGDGTNGDEGDATMAPTAAKGELQKQTLTAGETAGMAVVMP